MNIYIYTYIHTYIHTSSSMCIVLGKLDSFPNHQFPKIYVNTHTHKKKIENIIHHQLNIIKHHLVGGCIPTPLKNMSSSIGMMTATQYVGK